jgi:N-acetylneuraminate synthase/N,N'-diacetyllegionaminate synthase
MEGPDHKASLDPDELKAMVNAIRNIEIAITGSGKKEVSQSEMKNILIARKSVHLNNFVSAGNSIQEKDLIMKRPGTGISPMKIDLIIGKKIKTHSNSLFTTLKLECSVIIRNNFQIK